MVYTGPKTNIIKRWVLSCLMLKTHLLTFYITDTVFLRYECLFFRKDFVERCSYIH